MSILQQQRIKELEQEALSVQERLEQLEQRIAALEAKRGPGRPPKQVEADDGH